MKFLVLATALIGILQSLITGLALMTAQVKHKLPHQLLAGLFLTFAVITTGTILNCSGLIFDVPHLAQLHTPFRFLIGPLLWWYCRAACHSEFSLTKTAGWHLLPFLLDGVGLLPFYLLEEPAKVTYLTHALNTFPVEWRLRLGLVVLHLGMYLAVSVRTINRIQGEGVSQVPLLMEPKLLAWVFGGIWTLALIRLAVHFSLSSSLLIPALFSIFLCGASIVALQKSLHSEPVATDAPQSEPDIPISTPEPPSPRYQRSTLTVEESQIALHRLRRLMEYDKLFLDSTLTLAALAERVGLPAQHLSQVINEQCGQNFADFVNSYRIEEAKRRLHDQHFAHYSILAISEDSGFHSKSTFNTAFKKHTGLTPSEFRKQPRGFHNENNANSLENLYFPEP